MGLTTPCCVEEGAVQADPSPVCIEGGDGAVELALVCVAQVHLIGGHQDILL
jgi:hypothetical protein